MSNRTWRRILLSGSAAAVLVAAPAWAQEQDCLQKLDRIETRIGGAELPDDQRTTIVDAIERAHAGDGCEQAVAELEALVASLEASGELPAVAGDAGEERVASAATNPLQAMSASELLGTEVVDEQGDTVAEIVDLVKDGDTTYAVLSVGGFLGMGDKEVAMPMDRFELDADQRVVLPGASEDELEAMPAYDESAYEKVSEVN